MERINKTSEAARYRMLRASAQMLPDRPTQSGMNATEIKRALWSPILGEENSLLSEQGRIVDEINAALEALELRIEEGQALVGVSQQLITNAKTLIGAINENKGQNDANGDLIEQANAKIGDIDALATEAESLVGAINELLQKWNVLAQASEGMAADIGNVEELLTEAKTLVGAINESKRTSDQNATAIGNVTEVTIGSKGNLVDSINSLKYYHDVLQGDVRDILARLDAAAHNYVLRDFLEFVSYCKDEHDELSPGDLYTGDNVLIVEENVPDFWFEKTSDESLVETYTYEGVEYPLAARHVDGELMGVFHILESDYTVIEGYSSIASENAEAAVQAKKAAEESANAAGISASEAGISASEAGKSEEAAKSYSEEAKEAWHEVKEHKSHFANALVGHVRGNPGVISDLSPHSHTVECWAVSKNILPPMFTEDTSYFKGSTVTANGDGSFTVQKVAGETINKTITFPFKAGVYTLSSGDNISNKYWVQVTDIDVKTYYATTLNKASATFTLSQDTECKVTFYADASIAFDSLTFYPQIELGTVATPYTPYLESVEGLEVKVYGKNLLSDAVYDLNNWVRDEGISINSTNSKVYYLDEIPNGTYTISAKANKTGVYLYFYYSKDGGATWEECKGASGTNYIIASANAYTITFEKTDNTRFLLWLNAVNTLDSIEYIQIEAGDIATGTAPYKAPVSYITDANGYAELLSSTDDMTVVTDSRAVPDVTYQRDINALNTALDLNAVDERISAVNAENDAKLAEIRQGIGRIDARMSRAERVLGINEEGFVIVDNEFKPIAVPNGVLPFAQLIKIGGSCLVYTNNDETSVNYMYQEARLSYPRQLVADNGNVLFEITDEMASRLPDFGLTDENCIYFLNGKAIYHHEYVLGEYYHYMPPPEAYPDATFEYGIAYNSYGAWRLPQAIETDVTDLIDFDGSLNINGVKIINVVMSCTDTEILGQDGEIYELDYEDNGYVKIAFEV